MRSGFILLEVLISLVISSIIGILLFGAFTQTNRVVQRVETIADLQRRQIITLEQLKKDISGACIPLHTSSQTKITHVFYSINENQQLKTLTLITNNPLDIYQGNQASSITPKLVRIIYKLTPEKTNNSEKTSYQLTRTETPLLAYTENDPPAENTRTHVLARGIKLCKISYLIPDRTDDKISYLKTDSWDKENNETETNESQSNIILPFAATITLSLWENKKKTLSIGINYCANYNG
jgi:type II secretory pathway pseudopilin PulG